MSTRHQQAVINARAAAVQAQVQIKHQGVQVHRNIDDRQQKCTEANGRQQLLQPCRLLCCAASHGGWRKVMINAAVARATVFVRV